MKKLLICLVSAIFLLTPEICTAQTKEEFYYKGIKLTPVLIDTNAGLYEFKGDMGKIKDKKDIKNFIKFSNSFKPLIIDGNIFKKIAITKDNSYIKYHKIKTQKGYLRETIAVCYNSNISMYTKSSNTKRKWIKENKYQNCSK